VLSNKQRILNQIRGEEFDIPPIIGGWSLGVKNLAAFLGVSTEEYLKDPEKNVFLANKKLEVNGMVPPIVPKDLNAIRDGELQEESFDDVEPEVILERAEKIADSEEEIIRTKVNYDKMYKKYYDYFSSMQAQMGDMTYIITDWYVPVTFSLYFSYGYIAFLSAAALYPESLERIWWENSVINREHNHALLKVIKDLDVTPLVFCGDDICNNSGPMVSPEQLRRDFWPHNKYALEPLVEGGVRLVHHCDGNVMPLVDDMVYAGFSGFQGFQYECGVDIYDLRKRKSLLNEDMLIMGGLSVTRTLPYGTEQDVINEVNYSLDATDGGNGLLLFTSNVTGVEMPPENLVTAYDYLRSGKWKEPREKVIAPPALNVPIKI